MRGGWACRACEGRGRFGIDDYTGLPVNTAETPFADMIRTSAVCDRCGGWGKLGASASEKPGSDARWCDRCDGSGRVSALFSGHLSENARERTRQGDRQLDALTTQKERRDDLDCYRAVVDAIRSLKPGRRWLLVWTFVLHGQAPREQAWTVLDELAALIPLGVRPPVSIRLAAEQRAESLKRARGRAPKQAQAARDTEIRDLAKSLPHVEVARRMGISRVRVTQIVGRSCEAV